MSILSVFQTSPKAARRLRAEGDAARDSGNWKQAVVRYEAYLRTVPDDAAIWVQLGHAHKEMGNLDFAERSYLRALSLEPDNPDTHVQMGHVEKLRGNLEQSMARYRTALEIEPSFVAALSEFTHLESAFTRSDIDTANRRQADEDTGEQRADDVRERLEHLEDQGHTASIIASEMQNLRERVAKTDERIEYLISQLSNQGLIGDARGTTPSPVSVVLDKTPPKLPVSLQLVMSQADPAGATESATPAAAEPDFLRKTSVQQDGADLSMIAEVVGEFASGANDKALVAPTTRESTELERQFEFDIPPFFLPQVRYAVICHPDARFLERRFELQFWDRKSAIVVTPPLGFIGTGGVYVKQGEVSVAGGSTLEQVSLVPPYGAVRGQLKIAIKAKDPISFSGEPTLDFSQVCERAVGSAGPPIVGRSQKSGRSNVVVYSASSGPFRPDVLRLRPHYLAECFARWGYDVHYFPLNDGIGENQVAPGLRQFRRSDFFGYMQTLLEHDGAPGLFICSSLCNAETILLVDRIKDRGWKVLYEVRDDPEGMKGDSGRFGKWYNVNLERRLCALADAVTVVSSPLRDRAIAFGVREDKVFVYPNGIEDDMRFHANNSWNADAIALRRKDRTVVGYFGHMFGGRFDVDVVAQAARSMPEVKFELIGPGLENPKRLAMPNVKLYGQQTVDEFFRISKTWDVGLLPFKSNRITFSIDPIKYYQYIAAGLKVVNSDIYMLRGAPMTHLYDAEKSLTSVLRTTLDREVSVAEGKQLTDYLGTQTWESRAAATLAVLDLPQFAKDLGYFEQ